MSEDRDPHKAVDYILLNGKKFAKAKAERCYIVGEDREFAERLIEFMNRFERIKNKGEATI